MKKETGLVAMTTKSSRIRGSRYPTALVTLAVLTLLLAYSLSSEAAGRPLIRRPLDVLMRWDHQQGKYQEDSRHATSTDNFQKSRRNTGELDTDKVDRLDCGFDRLQRCTPSAQGSFQFPTFESKKEVPNGPNPLHN